MVFIPRFYRFAHLLMGIFLVSCGTKDNRWEYHETITGYPIQNSSRIILYPEGIRPPFALEIIRTRSGIKLYLNILRMEAVPHPEYNKRSSLDICIDEEKMTLHPYLLKGGQRLLFSEESRDLIIEALLKERQLKIKIGYRDFILVSSGFDEAYSRMQNMAQ